MPVNHATETVRLCGEVVRANELQPTDRDEMFLLMDRYYKNMCRDSFERDFAEKDWVIVARYPRSNRIMGFSTQMLIDVETVATGDRPAKVLFSGDTIIDREYWNRNPLAQLWGRLALTLIDEHADTDLFWLLISKGYKTYRFLPVFFHEFFPRVEAKTALWATELIDQLCCDRYPERFDASTGIIKASEFDCQLRDGVAEITPDRLTNKHVRFFQQRNPQHALGDELCCIARLTRENFKLGAYRVIGEQTAIRL